MNFRSSPYVSLAVVVVAAGLFPCCRIAWADPASIMGSGNISCTEAGASVAHKCEMLNAVGVRCARISITSEFYWWWGDGGKGAPQPEVMEGTMKTLQRYGITPVFTFEYYTRDASPYGTMLSYRQWFTVGRAFAAKYAPNSAWWLGQGIKNYGCRIYEAINEPDLDQPEMDKVKYHDALYGFADGVHSVSRALTAIPAGFGTPNEAQDMTCHGLAPAIADLLNDGTLDGIELHTYAGWWAPLEPRVNSASMNFKRVKEASGITRDIGFYCDEFNYNISAAEGGKSLQPTTDDVAAKYLLTEIWDNLGMTGNRGEPVCKLALVWSLLPVEPEYTLSPPGSGAPPTLRAKAYQLVAQLTSGMHIVAVDSYRSGVTKLTGAGRTLWAWQDRPNWTDAPGTSFTVTAIPRNAKELQVYGYDGLRETIPLSKQAQYTVTGLPGDETYMFVAR